MKTHFVFEGVTNAFVVLDVLLWAIDDADDAEFDGDDAATQNVDSVGAWNEDDPTL